MAGSRGSIKGFGHGTPLGRLLSVVLLCLLGYGATAEAIHRHGRIAPIQAADSSVRLDRQGADSNAQTLVNENDCTLCQLQRNLFAGLLYAPLRVIAPVVPERRTPAFSTSYLFALRTSQRGRAPPSTL
jgi:hypothetical protein